MVRRMDCNGHISNGCIIITDGMQRVGCDGCWAVPGVVVPQGLCVSERFENGVGRQNFFLHAGGGPGHFRQELYIVEVEITLKLNG